MGKLLLLLIVLVVGLAGTGYWNYQRNAGMDSDLAENRPYRAVPTADLNQIVAKTKKDIARAKGATAAAPTGTSAIGATDASDMGSRANAFSGFQRENERWKNQRGAIMEQEALLK